jgi:hypothetical protein
VEAVKLQAAPHNAPAMKGTTERKIQKGDLRNTAHQSTEPEQHQIDIFTSKRFPHIPNQQITENKKYNILEVRLLHIPVAIPQRSHLTSPPLLLATGTW